MVDWDLFNDFSSAKCWAISQVPVVPTGLLSVTKFRGIESQRLGFWKTDNKNKRLLNGVWEETDNAFSCRKLPGLLVMFYLCYASWCFVCFPFLGCIWFVKDIGYSLHVWKCKCWMFSILCRLPLINAFTEGSNSNTLHIVIYKNNHCGMVLNTSEVTSSIL